MNSAEGHSETAHFWMSGFVRPGLALCATLAAASCSESKFGSQDHILSERSRMLRAQQVAKEPQQERSTHEPESRTPSEGAPMEQDSDPAVVALMQTPLGMALSGCTSPTRCVNALNDLAGRLDNHFTDSLGGFQCTWIINSRETEVITIFDQHSIIPLGQHSFVRPDRLPRPEDCFTLSLKMPEITAALQNGSVTLTAIW